jgi:hypothetical protein
MTDRRWAAVAVVVLAVCGGMGPGLARAAYAASPPSSTTFAAGFAPNRLGAYSTIELGFHLYRPGGAVPPPLTGVEFLLPEGVSLTTSRLGLDVCEQTTIESAGATGCLPDAVMGYGNALMIAPTAVEGDREPAGVTILQAPPVEHHTTLLFDVSGSSPVISEVVFAGEMLDASGPFGGDLSTTFPLTPGLPGEKDVSVVSMHAGIGSKGVTYYNDVHGKRVPYTPQGVVIPSHCPAGGFPFEARFRFADGSTESASAASRCPSTGGGSGGRRSKR